MDNQGCGKKAPFNVFYVTKYSPCASLFVYVSRIPCFWFLYVRAREFDCRFAVRIADQDFCLPVIVKKVNAKNKRAWVIFPRLYMA